MPGSVSSAGSDGPPTPEALRSPQPFGPPQPPQPARPYTFADLGIPVEKPTETTFQGTTRLWSAIKRWEWVYLALSMICLTGSLGITIERIYSLTVLIMDPLTPTEDEQRADFTFALLLLWTTVFCYIYVFDGVKSERPYELMIFVATTVIVMIYVIMNYVESLRSPIKLARLVLVSTLGPVLIASGLKLSRDYYVSGNLIYRSVGANAEKQKMCKQVFLCGSLLKFELQLGGSAVILWLQNSFMENKVDSMEMSVVVVGAIVTALWVTAGFVAMRLENKTLVWVFFATSVFEPVLIIANLIRTTRADRNIAALTLSVYACGILALVVRGATMWSMRNVMNNFGLGLRERLFTGTSGFNNEANKHLPAEEKGREREREEEPRSIDP